VLLVEVETGQTRAKSMNHQERNSDGGKEIALAVNCSASVAQIKEVENESRAKTNFLEDDGFGGRVYRRDPTKENEERRLKHRYKNKRRKEKGPSVQEILQKEEKERRDPESNINLPYMMLLNRAFEQIKPRDKKKKLRMPNLVFVPKRGGRVVVFANSDIVSTKLNRDVEHLKKFMTTELCTTGECIGGDIIQLRYRWSRKAVPNLTSVVKKYVIKYVQCRSCKCFATKIDRNKKKRTWTMKCESCGSCRNLERMEQNIHKIATKASRRESRQKRV